MFVVFISSLSVHYERPTIRIEQKKKKKDSKPPQNESSNYGTTPWIDFLCILKSFTKMIQSLTCDFEDAGAYQCGCEENDIYGSSLSMPSSNFVYMNRQQDQHSNATKINFTL